AVDEELRARAAFAFAAFGEAASDVEQNAALHDFVDETDFFRAPSVELLSVEDDVERRRKPDEARKLRRAAPRREDAEVHFGQSDFGFRIVGHHSPVAGERELASAAETRAVDGGHFHLTQFREAMQRLLAESRVLL